MTSKQRCIHNVKHVAKKSRILSFLRTDVGPSIFTPKTQGAFFHEKVSYMSAHALFNLINEIGKRDKI